MCCLRRDQVSASQGSCLSGAPDAPLTDCTRRAAVSNSHTLGSLKPQTCVPPHPGGQKSEIRVWVCLAPSEGAWGEFVPSLFQLLVAAGITWLVAPSLSAMLSHHLFFYISVLMHSVSLF